MQTYLSEPAQRLVWTALFVLVVFALMTTPAFAATTNGSEFEPLYEMLSAWTTGFLGKSIAITFLIVGLGMGIIRGSIVAAVACIAAAVSLLLAPGIIDGMFGIGS